MHLLVVTKDKKQKHTSKLTQLLFQQMDKVELF